PHSPAYMCLLLFFFIMEPAVFVPSECCFHFYVDRLPKNKVDDYRLTSPHCPNKGIIVRMQNGKEFCVNPDQRWVKETMERMEMSSLCT
uniref:Chemokine interleukin-8-like domain-containing protein n=1 Tax=Neogobius melanostomus TaxID=47308 RepID=A0A8C6SIZ1_9GOBI